MGRREGREERRCEVSNVLVMMSTAALVLGIVNFINSFR